MIDSQDHSPNIVTLKSPLFVSDVSFFHLGHNYSVRLAKDSDVPAIRLLVNAAYKELADLGLNYTGSYQDEETTRERMRNGRTFILQNGNRIVGSVLLTTLNIFTGSHSAYVSQLAIHPNFKRFGLGTKLMELCENVAKRDGFAAIQLDTAKPAAHLVKWYLGRGYEIVSEAQWEGKTYGSWIFEKSLMI